MGGFLLWFIILCVIIGSRVSRENKKNQNRNLNRPPQTQGKIDQMGQKKAEKIPLHSENRQQQIQ